MCQRTLKLVPHSLIPAFNACQVEQPAPWEQPCPYHQHRSYQACAFWNMHEQKRFFEPMTSYNGQKIGSTTIYNGGKTSVKAKNYHRSQSTIITISLHMYRKKTLRTSISTISGTASASVDPGTDASHRTRSRLRLCVDTTETRGTLVLRDTFPRKVLPGTACTLLFKGRTKRVPIVHEAMAD